MKFAEVFYPKELKQLISDLEREQNLQRKPLRLLNRLITFYCMVSFVMVVLVMLLDGIIIGVIAFFIFSFLFFYMLHHEVRFYILYSRGTPSIGSITKIRTNEYTRAIPSSKIECVRSEDHTRFVIARVSNDRIKNDNLCKGAAISFYTYKKYPTFAALDCLENKLHYCLNQSFKGE